MALEGDFEQALMAMDLPHLHRKAFGILRSSRNLVLVSHRRPDGDTLGAACAIAAMCRENGIPFQLYCGDTLPPQYAFLPESAGYTTDAAVFANADVVAVFDVGGNLRFCGIADIIAALPARPTILNFDHHVTNELFGDVNIVDVAACSTTDVVQHFLRDVGLPLSREVATAVLTGVLTDTFIFANPNTTSGAFETAAEAVRRGAKIGEVVRCVVRNKPLGAMRVWGLALSRLKFHDRLGIASTAVFLDDVRANGLEEEHLEGISNFLGTTLRVPAVLVLRELEGGKVKGSLRTQDALDVSMLAGALGGGGHKKAAGFTVSGTLRETAAAWMVERK